MSFEDEIKKPPGDAVKEIISQEAVKFFAENAPVSEAVQDAFFEGASAGILACRLQNLSMAKTMEGLTDEGIRIEIAPKKVTHQFPTVGPGVYSLNLGNSTYYEVMLINYVREYYFISILGIGCYRFQGSAVHPSYTKEKFGVPDKDAANLSDFINDLLGLDEARHGHYLEEFCV